MIPRRYVAKRHPHPSSGYKVPDRIEVVDSLPRTPRMKIGRRALRDAVKVKQKR